MKAGCYVTDDERSGDFIAGVERDFELERGPAGICLITPYDTFDWRLYRSRLFAYASQDAFIVQRSFSRSPLIECEVKPVPRFWWEFRDARVRDLFEGITGIRALLPLATLEIREQRYRVRNDDGKIVARFSLLAHAARGAGGRSYLVIDTLRGYADEGSLLHRMARGSAMEGLPGPFLEELLKVQGIRPGDYSSRLDLSLSRKQTVTEAALIIHRHLSSAMRSNIPGIIQDYDTEFLHDFRVATRRTRACLSQVKEAFPPEVTKKFNAGFKQTAQQCNVLRDLDVYLLEKQRYYDLLPQHLHKGLDQYFAYIKRSRNYQQRKFSAFLQSEAFLSLLEDWEGFLEDPQTPAESPKAIDVARSRIAVCFRRIIKRGRAITDTSPDKDLHSLRIDCKRLRYLLEFFTSLFPQKEMDKLIRQLKVLQDNLGEFNDLAVQQVSLGAYLQRSESGKQREQPGTASIGGLLAVLPLRQNEVRKGFYRSFAEFDSRQVHAISGRLFGKG